MITGLIAGTITWLVMFIIATYATAATKVVGTPPKIETIETKLPPDQVLARLRQLPEKSSFRIDGSYALPNGICLTWTPDLSTFGWFYPIIVTPTESGSRIEIGIVPRLFGGGKQLLKYHQKALEFVNAQLA